jgi:hypothetical protein
VAGPVDGSGGREGGAVVSYVMRSLAVHLARTFTGREEPPPPAGYRYLSAYDIAEPYGPDPVVFGSVPRVSPAPVRPAKVSGATAGTEN